MAEQTLMLALVKRLPWSEQSTGAPRRAGGRSDRMRPVGRLTSGLEELFAPVGYGGRFEQAFFPAELRNPIVEAGSGKRLLELRYHGVTRFVEPYALTFKRRKDGAAREYFYAWSVEKGEPMVNRLSACRLHHVFGQTPLG